MNGLFSLRSLPRISRCKSGLSTLIVAAALTCLIIILLHLLAKQQSDNVTYKDFDIELPDNFKPVRITKRESFPSNGPPKIPKIIHQVWKGIYVPSDFVGWVKSWNTHHPDWEYWLWTEKSARQFLLERFPCFVDLYDNYPEKIRRADAIRYLVLYEFGGVYVDLDMEALGSILPMVLKYSCFFGKEPFEHPIFDTNFKDLINNAIMGCRPKHPFMKLLVDNLDRFSKQWHHLDSTGPHFVSFIYRMNESLITSEKGEDAVYIAPSEYFYPTIEPYKLWNMNTMCRNKQTLSQLQILACMNLKYKSLPQNRFDPITIAFTNHHWYHTYLKQMPFVRAKYKSIFDIIPEVHIYKDIQV